MYASFTCENVVKSSHERLIVRICLKNLGKNHIFVPTFLGDFYVGRYLLFSPFLVLI